MSAGRDALRRFSIAGRHGAGALADRWRVTDQPALRAARFQVSGGAFLCTIQPQCTVLLLR